MNKIEKAARQLDRSLKRLEKLTNAFSVATNAQGQLEMLVGEPDFNKLPGASEAERAPRKSDMYPFSKKVTIGNVVFQCLLGPEQTESKEGES